MADLSAARRLLDDLAEGDPEEFVMSCDARGLVEESVLSRFRWIEKDPVVFPACIYGGYISHCTEDRSIERVLVNALYDTKAVKQEKLSTFGFPLKRIEFSLIPMPNDVPEKRYKRFENVFASVDAVDPNAIFYALANKLKTDNPSFLLDNPVHVDVGPEICNRVMKFPSNVISRAMTVYYSSLLPRLVQDVQECMIRAGYVLDVEPLVYMCPHMVYPDSDQSSLAKTGAAGDSLAESVRRIDGDSPLEVDLPGKSKNIRAFSSAFSDLHPWLTIIQIEAPGLIARKQDAAPRVIFAVEVPSAFVR